MAARTALAEVSSTGEFKRTDAGYRNKIAPGTRFPPEAGRYHLYISLACPWAARCAAVRNLKGLQDVISMTSVHPTWQRTKPDNPNDQHTGWVFRAVNDPPVVPVSGFGAISCEGCAVDPINGVKTVRELYELVGDTIGKYTTPVLWDIKEKAIVNNESSEIIRMFNDEFNHLATNPSLDLYPERLRKAIDETNEWVYPMINNGVYRCGFALQQEPYDQAFKEVFEGLDRVEGILSRQRFIAGDALTEADVRLFVTLIRFDPVYVVYFKTNNKFIREYPNIREYVKDVYHLPGVKESVNMHHIKTHYFTSHPRLNSNSIVPGGVDPWWEEAPVGRDFKA